MKKLTIIYYIRNNYLTSGEGIYAYAINIQGISIFFAFYDHGNYIS